jgi:hypothetical protein
MSVKRMQSQSYVEFESSCGHQALISQTLFLTFFCIDKQFPVKKPLEEYIFYMEYRK